MLRLLGSIPRSDVVNKPGAEIDDRMGRDGDSMEEKIAGAMPNSQSRVQLQQQAGDSPSSPARAHTQSAIRRVRQ
eukprot:c31361_g1_i1 orf=71-295(+)